MWPILACSIISVAVFAERFFYLHRATIHVGEFLKGLSNLIQRRNFAEALHESAGTPGPVARVIHAALLRHDMPRSELREIVQEAGQLEVPKLERFLGVLATLAFLAPLLGLNIGLRQSFLAILVSFTIASAILGAFSPLLAFVIWNAPPLAAGAQQWRATYNSILLLQVIVIAFAGVAANLRLVQLLRRLSRNPAIAHRVLFAWLAGNFFFGSQLTWILRPFIGSPGLPVEFVRHEAFHGNFYETVFQSLIYLITHK